MSVAGSGILLLLIILLVPETYAPVLLRRKAIRLRAETGDQRFKAPIEIMQRSITRTVLRSCYRPFMLLFLEPSELALIYVLALPWIDSTIDGSKADESKCA